ncbi:MAG: peptide-methionine (S)-S-oxide reductase [Chloroflexi bacterium HGW-Chloroflexi-2]|jgi:methionine-S-sulfoxide reductase|nr:MAG: peptide-methionine (S)-S-oxide reductase [Chloroflexi bacterium HGW-Chloroflexi-2]
MNEKFRKIVLGGGCFWCLDPIYKNLTGVEDVVVGYAGGAVPSPTYEQVCTGRTGHAEVVEVTYDPEMISLNGLLNVFFQVHDPTTLNRQGADVGTQYRSIILVKDEAEKEQVEEIVEKIDQSDLWRSKIVTQIEILSEFYPAEDYHQDYYEKNPWAGYCQVVINPKLKKFKQKFASQLKQ